MCGKCKQKYCHLINPGLSGLRLFWVKQRLLIDLSGSVLFLLGGLGGGLLWKLTASTRRSEVSWAAVCLKAGGWCFAG